jgi:ketosteroid isomerase-like protein
MAVSDTERVQAMIENWAGAIETGDRPGILADHADDLLMFDFPSVVRGIKAYDETWDFFFANPKGAITFKPSDFQVTAGDRVAFASCQIHCDGTSAGPLDLRLTVGLEKRNGRWIITHEHHSVPTTEERFVSP